MTIMLVCRLLLNSTSAGVRAQQPSATAHVPLLWVSCLNLLHLQGPSPQPACQALSTFQLWRIWSLCAASWSPPACCP
jgi:hypothetical protein